MLKKISFANLTLLCAFVMLAVVSCNKSVGIKKDLNTGLSSSYKNMAPENVYLMMNDKELKTNNIPLGEKFVVINNNVKGITQKDGKVSVGCSLKITDAAGKVLLDEADLFAGEDIFKPEEAQLLRCTVTTGMPMEPGKAYDVKVRFWDKYGDGSIENELTINAIEY